MMPGQFRFDVQESWLRLQGLRAAERGHIRRFPSYFRWRLTIEHFLAFFDLRMEQIRVLDQPFGIVSQSPIVPPDSSTTESSSP